MRRLLASLCFVFLFGQAALAGAQTASPSPAPEPPEWADPFCSASAGFDYWDVANNRGIDATSTNALLGRLWAHGSSVSAHVVFFSDTDAYEATISPQPLSGDKYFRGSSQFLIALPKAMPIRYAYVDSYQVDGGPSVDCPTEAHAFQKGTSQRSPVDLKTTPTFAATYKQALPQLTCGKVYIPATLMRAERPRSVPTTKVLTVRIAIFVNSDGALAKSYVYKSSGVDLADTLALDAANRSAYVAAQFLCTPIVGEYLFTADFEP